jgi:hypothetical protein
MSSADVEATLFEMLSRKDSGKSIGPEEVAKIIDPEAWRRILPRVRTTAIGLARQGKLVITRHGKPADPNQFRGVYRLRLPTPDDVLPVQTTIAVELDINPEEIR